MTATASAPDARCTMADRAAPPDPFASLKAAFAKAMAEFAPEAMPAGGVKLAVACSGGGDSLALALLARDWMEATGAGANAKPVALIVDHQLQPQSGAIAGITRTRLRDAGIPAHILTRDGPPFTRNIQARAREARYGLLRDWCLNHGIGILATAHHREDQAETFLLRLARGSGVDGLAAMAAARDLGGGVRLIRPLLGTGKGELAEYLTACGLEGCRDPGNHDRRFARTRIRSLMPTFAAEGLDAKRLARTATAMGRARHALERARDELSARCCRLQDEGYAVVEREGLLAAPQEIGLRLLADLLCRVSGRVWPPRLARLLGLYAALRDGTIGGGRTLAGCRIMRAGGRARDRAADSAILICREPKAMQRAVALCEAMVWDGRFALRFAHADPRLCVRGLGTDGWRQARAMPDFVRVTDAVTAASPLPPSPVRPTLPGIFAGPKLLCIPHLALWVPDGAAHKPGALRFLGQKRDGDHCA